jgi:hypothetical protein
MAGSTMKRVEVKIDSVTFWPLEARYTVTRNANQVGRRIGDSLQARVSIWADAHDVSRLSQANLIELWKMSTETKDPLHKVSVTWFLDDESKVLSNVEFQGWITTFETTNPTISGSNSPTASQVGINNLFYMEMAVVLDEANISKHKLHN